MDDKGYEEKLLLLTKAMDKEIHEKDAEVERLRGREAELEGILRVEEMYQKEMKARITELEARNLYLRSLVEDDEEGPVEEKHRLEREVAFRSPPPPEPRVSER